MEEYKDCKDYYKVYEIARALREYLKEGYRILYEMLSLIDIKSDVPYNAEIKIAQSTATNLFSKHIIYKDGPYKGEILLFISKSGFSLARMIQNYKTRYIEEESPLYSVDNADFIIEKKDGQFVFVKRYNHDIPNAYRPELNILDLDKFSELYKRLEEEGYLTYPEIIYFYRGNPNFSFELSSQTIHLEQTQPNGRCLMIDYNPSNDSLFIRDNRKNPELTPEQMFCLPIAKEEIYKEYVSLIDKNLTNEKLLDSMFYLDNKGNLRLDSKNNNLSKVLRKKI